MQTTLQGKDLSVAILMDDLSGAKEIATSLRSNGIMAHHYKTLEDFWGAINMHMPDLAIVDVTKMSQGNIQFRFHPKVVEQKLSYAFYSKDSTKILLQSTLGLKPVGFLHHDASLNSQIASLVTQRVAEMKSAFLIKDMEARLQRLQSRSQRIISERTSAEEFKTHFEFIRTFTQQIEEEATRLDFSHCLISKLDNWEAVEAFGLFELNQNGQKLISPEISRKKYHPFPSLWLGQTNTDGIEEFAQSMANQVAQDLFENEPTMIKISGGSNKPDMLLFISTKEERMLDFPWEVFATMLSSSLRRIKLFQKLPQYTSQFMPMWEALDLMDKMQNDTIDPSARIVCLSLIPLTEVTKRKPNNKFYWSSFFNDFFLQLSGRIQKTTKLSTLGPWHVIFFIPKENVEAETQMIQNFVKQFSFWKFFEDDSQILSEDMQPSLKLLPASSSHYFRIFEKEFEDLNLSQEMNKKITASFKQSRALI
jgi:hypothetical protein